VDSVKVTIEMYDPTTVANYVYYAACAGDTPHRTQLPGIAIGAEGYVYLSGQGIVNLYFEAVSRDSYYYVNPQRDFLATVWLVPVRIN
jgi:hypothetical protein